MKNILQYFPIVINEARVAKTKVVEVFFKLLVFILHVIECLWLAAHDGDQPDLARIQIISRSSTGIQLTRNYSQLQGIRKMKRQITRVRVV